MSAKADNYKERSRNMLEKYEMLNQERKKLDKKRKVAAYCRVSTDNEDQANSFESQQRYFKQYIEHHPDWELYEIFADEGISGTNTKKRKQFNRMIACAKNGDFDLIITGEGKIDASSAYGKAPLGVARLAQKYQVPVIAVGGQVGPGQHLLYP